MRCVKMKYRLNAVTFLLKFIPFQIHKFYLSFRIRLLFDDTARYFDLKSL